MMQTQLLMEGQQSRYIFTQPPCSTAPNNPGHNGGWDHRSPAFVYQTPPVPPADHPQYRRQQDFQSRHVANFNCRYMEPPNACPFPVSASLYPNQENTNLNIGPGHQLPLRNLFSAIGDVSYASPPANFLNTLCTAQQIPMRPDVCAARENQQNTRVPVRAHDCNISKETMHFYRCDDASQLPTSRSHGNCAVNQSHLQRGMIQRQSTGRKFSIPAAWEAGGYSSAECSIPAVQDAGTYSSAQFLPCRFGAKVDADQGALNNGPEAVRNDRMENLNLPSASKAVMVRQKGSGCSEVRGLRQEMGNARDVTKNCGKELRLNPNFKVQDHVHRTLSGDQALTTSIPNSAVLTTAPAQNTSPHLRPQQLMDHTVNENNPLFSSGKRHTLSRLFHNLSQKPGRIQNAGVPLVQAQFGEKAIRPQSSMNPSGSPGSRSSESMNRHSAVSAEQSYQCIPSQSAAGHLPQYHAFHTQQKELLSTSAQPPKPQGRGGRYTQGAANQNNRHRLTIPQQYFSPSTKSGGTDEVVKHIKAMKAADHAPNRPSVSGNKCCDTVCYHEPGMQPRHNQTSGNSMTGSERQEISVTTRQVNAFTAGNDSCMGSQPASQGEAEQKRSQMSSAGHRKDHGVTCATESPQTSSSHISDAGSPYPEPVFKPPKESSQQTRSSSCLLSQKAVAVVPPLSPQSRDPADETSSTQSDLPCKILSVISLSEESAAGLFDFKMTEAAFECLLASMGAGEKDPQNIVQSTANLASKSTALAVPHKQIVSQTTDSTCQVIPPAPDDFVPEKFDPQTSNQQKSDPTLPANAAPSYMEEMSPPDMHCHEPVTQAGVTFHENCDQDGDLEKTVFDLSSVAINEWTIAQLVKLISFLHQTEGTPKQEMDVNKTAELYGLQGYNDLPDVFSSDLYQSIMAEARSMFREDENSVVLSEIHPTSLKAVAENCQILKHYPVLPNEIEHKVVKLNQAEKGKTVRTTTVMLRSNGDTPLSSTKSQADSARVDGAVDALSSIKIGVLPPEEARRIFCGEDREVVKLDDSQSYRSAQEGQGDETTLMEVKLSQWCLEEQQEEEKLVNMTCCPFCLMKVTNDKYSFCKCQSKLEQGGEGESKMGTSSNRIIKDETVELIERFVEGDRTLAAENNTISVQATETTNEELPEDDQPRGDQLDHDQPEHDLPEHDLPEHDLPEHDLPEHDLPEQDLPEKDQPKQDQPEEDQNIKNKAPPVSECPQSRPADDSAQEEGNSEEGEAVVSSGEPDEGRSAPDPSDCSSSEMLFDSDITLHEVIIPVQNVSEVENDHSNSDYEETLKMAAAVSEQLWKESIAKGELPVQQQADVDDVPTSGLDVEGDLALGSTWVDSHSERPCWLPGPMDFPDLERLMGRKTSISLRQRLHKRLSSTEKHGHKGENACKRRREKSTCSTSPVRDPSPQSAKVRKMKGAVTVIKRTKHRHDNREKPLLTKRKGDHCSTSPKSKLPKLHKDERLSQGRNVLKSPTASKGNSSKELPKQKTDGRGLCLTLYGSSRAGNRTVNFNEESVFKSHGGKILPAPTTLGLSINSKDSNHADSYIKCPAKQQVFSIWERSLVPLLHSKRSKTGTPKQGRIKRCANQGRTRTQTDTPNVCGNDLKSSRVQCTSKSSSQRTATTVKHRESITHKREEKRNMTPKTGKNHLGRNQENGFLPKACNKHLGKSQEKKCSIPKLANKHLEKYKEKNSFVHKACSKHREKILEKTSSLPKETNKYLDKFQEKKSSAAKLVENNFASHFFVRQSLDFPSMRKTSRDTRQQVLEKASLSSCETQAMAKNNRPKNVKFKKVEPVHLLGRPRDPSQKNPTKTKNITQAGRSDRTAVSGTTNVLLPPSFQLKGGPGRVKCEILENKTSCAKSPVGKNTSCSKEKSHGIFSTPIPPRVTFQDHRPRHMAQELALKSVVKAQKQV